MATAMKLSLAFVILLLSGLVVFGDVGDAAATCHKIRCFQGGNITCENYTKVIQGCVCLCAPKKGKGCILQLSDGTTQNCTKTNY